MVSRKFPSKSSASLAFFGMAAGLLTASSVLAQGYDPADQAVLPPIPSELAPPPGSAYTPAPMDRVYTGPPGFGSTGVPTTAEGRPLRAFGAEPPKKSGFFGRLRDADRQIDPAASKFQYSDPFSPERGAGSDTYTMTPVLAPDGSAVPVADTTPLISNLDGIVLVPQELQVRKDGARGVQGILNDGVILPPAVEQVLAVNLNQPLSLASLDAMVRECIVAYRASDMPVVDVLVPEQQIQTGVLQLVVIEGRLGDIKVEGATHSDPAYLSDQVSLRSGEVITESALMQDLAWMNRNPFRRVDLIYSPGRSYGTTDIILRTEDTRPFSVYAGYEDSGNELIGRDRFLGGFNWGGPLFFSNESVFSYQYVSDFDFEALQGHSGVWTSLLPWKHHLTLLGAVVNSEAVIEVDDQILETGGKNDQASIRYAVPLVYTGASFTHELEFGFDYKSSNSNLFFNTLDVFDTTSEIFQLSLGYNAVARDRHGQTKLDTEVVYSPGDLSSQNDDETFRSQRGGAEADYIYARAAVERNNRLPADFSLITRIEGQLSDTNLLASETLGAGGYDTVRGYEQRLVRGDNGVLASVELRTPTLSLTNVSGFRNIRDGLQFLTFYDYGYLENTDKVEGEADNLQLGSVGVGLRYQFETNLSIRLDYGWQVNESGFDDGEDGRLHVGARASF